MEKRSCNVQAGCIRLLHLTLVLTHFRRDGKIRVACLDRLGSSVLPIGPICHCHSSFSIPIHSKDNFTLSQPRKTLLHCKKFRLLERVNRSVPSLTSSSSAQTHVYAIHVTMESIHLDSVEAIATYPHCTSSAYFLF